jgi:prolyl oligopeptidase
VYYHQLGWTAEQDVLFYETPETPQYLFGVEVSDDGQTLLLTMHDSCDPVNRLFYFDLRSFDGKDVKTIGTPDRHRLGRTEHHSEFRCKGKWGSEMR